jgi:hypothetical protein
MNPANEIDSRDAETSSLRRLLGGSPRGVAQDPSGSYGGDPRPLSDAELDAHLAGVRTVGFSVANGGRAWFLAYDLDDRFRQRLPFIASAIDARGLAAAAIATAGSDPNRGKVIVFFEKARSVVGLRRLAYAILDEARESARAASGPWGVEDPKSLTVFPLKGEGGIVRIGGRNRDPARRATTLETLFSLNGEPRRFSDVVPARRVRVVEAEPVTSAPVGKWVKRLRARGVSYSAGGSKGVVKALTRLASESVRVFGNNPHGYAMFSAWCGEVWHASPDQHGPSPSGDVRAARSWERRCSSAWDWATRQKDTLSSPAPRPRRGLDNVSGRRCRGCGQVLAVLATYAAKKGMTPDAFTCSYRQIAEHVGWSSHMTAWKHVQKHLLPAGAIVVHDRGTRGEKGLPVLLGLVSEGESPEAVISRASRRRNVQRRKHERAAFEARKYVRQHEYDDARSVDFDLVDLERDLREVA